MIRPFMLVTSASLVMLMFGLWIPFKALLAQELLERAWVKSQAQHTEQRPWSWADTWPVAKLDLPELGVSMIVLEGGHGESLAFGPGRVLGGERGPLILAGHRDTHFRHLKNVQTGTQIRVQDRSQQWRHYEVTDVSIVDSRTEAIDTLQLAQDSVLLITCYPFDSLDARGPLRYVVKARPVSQTGSNSAVAIL